ncbi:interferon-induced helicase C domain-containing protein 1 isoform X1 [Biomphalaria pfeifferi]|uniref:Interferon-induced helicase C domain-containing protein 1 isoform X1 n=1 Tax=Biomphalaria pfeifferi TaxID=112525 RepID=A0AAD8BW32_BIOPF|nr:interferon-induced helicase C domain-containing protein 1 isoform X1 [Biomphalaria pfeifferi]
MEFIESLSLEYMISCVYRPYIEEHVNVVQLAEMMPCMEDALSYLKSVRSLSESVDIFLNHLHTCRSAEKYKEFANALMNAEYTVLFCALCCGPVYFDNEHHKKMMSLFVKGVSQSFSPSEVADLLSNHGILSATHAMGVKLLETEGNHADAVFLLFDSLARQNENWYQHLLDALASLNYSKLVSELESKYYEQSGHVSNAPINYSSLKTHSVNQNEFAVDNSLYIPDSLDNALTPFGATIDVNKRVKFEETTLMNEFVPTTQTELKSSIKLAFKQVTWSNAYPQHLSGIGSQEYDQRKTSIKNRKPSTYYIDNILKQDGSLVSSSRIMNPEDLNGATIDVNTSVKSEETTLMNEFLEARQTELTSPTQTTSLNCFADTYQYLSEVEAQQAELNSSIRLAPKQVIWSNFLADKPQDLSDIGSQEHEQRKSFIKTRKPSTYYVGNTLKQDSSLVSLSNHVVKPEDLKDSILTDQNAIIQHSYSMPEEMSFSQKDSISPEDLMKFLFVKGVSQSFSPSEVADLLSNLGILSATYVSGVKLLETEGNHEDAVLLLLNSLAQQNENWYQHLLDALASLNYSRLVSELDPEYYERSGHVSDAPIRFPSQERHSVNQNKFAVDQNLYPPDSYLTEEAVSNLGTDTIEVISYETQDVNTRVSSDETTLMNELLSRRNDSVISEQGSVTQTAKDDAQPGVVYPEQKVGSSEGLEETEHISEQTLEPSRTQGKKSVFSDSNRKSSFPTAKDEEPHGVLYPEQSAALFEGSEIKEKSHEQALEHSGTQRRSTAIPDSAFGTFSLPSTSNRNSLALRKESSSFVKAAKIHVTTDEAPLITIFGQSIVVPELTITAKTYQFDSEHSLKSRKGFEVTSKRNFVRSEPGSNSMKESSPTEEKMYKHVERSDAEYEEDDPQP